MARILLIDDDPEQRSALRNMFENLGHCVADAPDGKRGVSSACSRPCDLVMLDIDLPKRSGVRALKAIVEEWPELAVVVTTEDISTGAAIEALKFGALAYLRKPLNPEEVKIVAERALEQGKLTGQNDYLLGQLRGCNSFSCLIGANQYAREAYALAKQVAATDSSVLIVGEGGTGRECVARSIHYASSRARQPFVKVQCSAISENTVDPLLSQVEGLESGDGGAIFLDEVSSLASGVQERLPSVLESRIVSTPRGKSAGSRKIRVISSSSRDLTAMVEAGVFSEALYKLLSAFTISLPPLRERPEDIPALVDHFIKKYALATGKPVSSISNIAMAQILVHDWQGNIRELENCIERSVIYCDGNCIQPSHLGLSGRYPGSKRKQQPLRPLREIERDYIKRILIQCNWNKSAAANALDIDRKTLRSKIREFGFVPPEDV